MEAALFILNYCERNTKLLLMFKNCAYSIFNCPRKNRSSK